MSTHYRVKRRCSKLLHNAVLLPALNFLTTYLAHNKLKCGSFISKLSEFMLEVYPVCLDTSAKMTTPLADSGINGDVASSIRAVRGRPLPVTRSTDPVRSIFSNKVFKPPLVQFFVLNSLRKRAAVYPFICRKFIIKVLSSFEKTTFTLLADEKLKIIFITVSAIFSVKYLIPQNY